MGKIAKAEGPITISDINKGISISSLEEAQKRILELEEKLAALEVRIPKKYPEIKFLNYHSRKRILVIFIISSLLFFFERKVLYLS